MACRVVVEGGSGAQLPLLKIGKMRGAEPPLKHFETKVIFANTILFPFEYILKMHTSDAT